MTVAADALAVEAIISVHGICKHRCAATKHVVPEAIGTVAACGGTPAV